MIFQKRIRNKMHSYRGEMSVSISAINKVLATYGARDAHKKFYGHEYELGIILVIIVEAYP